jgi:hypothetical protein
LYLLNSTGKNKASKSEIFRNAWYSLKMPGVTSLQTSIDYIALNGKMINELKNGFKGSSHGLIEVLSWHLLEGLR